MVFESLLQSINHNNGGPESFISLEYLGLDSPKGVWMHFVNENFMILTLC